MSIAASPLIVQRSDCVTSRSLMDLIDPVDFLRLLDRLDIHDVDHDGLIARAHEHAFDGLAQIGVDLLMRHIGRHEDEVAGSRPPPRTEVARPSASVRDVSRRR